MVEITQSDLIDWRALVRNVARSITTIAAEYPREDAHDIERAETCLAAAQELRRLGDWLDSLAGVPMGKPVNGHGRVSL